LQEKKYICENILGMVRTIPKRNPQ